eukprot:11031572-Ditylum_brightwellii.AAC.1
MARGLPHPTSHYSTWRSIEHPRRGVQYIEYPPFRGYKYTFYVKYPPFGGMSILSTQPYQGGRIVYVMCNPTALVYKGKHVAFWPSSVAPHIDP